MHYECCQRTARDRLSELRRRRRSYQIKPSSNAIILWQRISSPNANKKPRQCIESLSNDRASLDNDPQNSRLLCESSTASHGHPFRAFATETFPRHGQSSDFSNTGAHLELGNHLGLLQFGDNWRANITTVGWCQTDQLSQQAATAEKSSDHGGGRESRNWGEGGILEHVSSNPSGCSRPFRDGPRGRSDRPHTAAFPRVTQHALKRCPGECRGHRAGTASPRRLVHG